MSLRRGVAGGQNVIKSEISLGLPFMVLDLECKFQMIFLKGGGGLTSLKGN